MLARWLSTDPNAQYYFPYVGMGNNPVDRIDPDGGLDDIKFNTGTGTTTTVKTNDDFDRYFVDNKYQGWADKGAGGLMWDNLTSIGFGNIFTPYGDFNRGYISNTVFVTPSSWMQLNGGFNIDNAILTLNYNALFKPSGYCARYVRYALEAGGINTNGRPGSAKDYDPRCSKVCCE